MSLTAVLHRSLLALALCAAVQASAAPAGPDLGSTAPAATAASPAPGALGGDRITQFLQDTGVLAREGSGSGSPLIQQVRDTASDLVISAMQFLGVPYRRGGTSESGFDCSGFTRHVFENSLGLLLPRRSRDQARSEALLSVNKDELRPGDLVFFNTMRSAFSHVGIYVGEGKFIHSPRSGSSVRVEDMRDAYWTKRFNGARRAPAIEAQTLIAGRAEAAARDALGDSVGDKRP